MGALVREQRGITWKNVHLTLACGEQRRGWSAWHVRLWCRGVESDGQWLQDLERTRERRSDDVCGMEEETKLDAMFAERVDKESLQGLLRSDLWRALDDITERFRKRLEAKEAEDGRQEADEGHGPTEAVAGSLPVDGVAGKAASSVVGRREKRKGEDESILFELD